MRDFGRDYLSVWCLIPRRGLAVCLSVEGRLTELKSRAMCVMSAPVSVNACL